MEVVKKKININHITGNTFSIPVFLTQKTKNVGYLTDLSEDLTLTKMNVTVTGETSNKLDMVRSWDYNETYKVGHNGVTEATGTYVSYKIDNINYTTYLNDLKTIFSFTTEREVYTKNNFVHEDLNLGKVDKVEVKDLVQIERQAISIIERVSRLRQVNTVEEFNNFGNSYYKINNQTI